MKFIPFTIFIALIGISNLALAQTEESSSPNKTTVPTTSNEEVFTLVEQLPEYPGGKAMMHEYMAKNFKYPIPAKNNNIQGRVYVTFVIEKDGSVSNAQVVRGIGSGCDEEALRLVNSMPKWTPGIQKGEPVRVKYTLPISFKLQQSTAPSEPKTKKELKAEKKALKKQNKK